MNKTTITKLALKALAFCLLAMTGRIASAQSFTLDFESPTYVSGQITNQDGWAFSANQGTTNMQIRTDVEITNILVANGLPVTFPTVHGGTQAFLTTGGDASTTVLRTNLGTINSNGIVNFDLWALPLTPSLTNARATNLGNIFVTIEDSSGVRAAAFRFGYDAATNNAHIDFASGLVGSAVWTNSGMHWTSNTWYHIAFTVDYGAQTYDFFVNGTKLNTAPIPFYNNDNTSAFTRIAVVRGAQQAGMILDDFNVTSTAVNNPFARMGNNNSIYAWKFRILDLGSLTPDTNTLAIKVDGVTVVPTGIVQSGNIGSDGSGVTTVYFESTTPLFTLGSTHTAAIHFEGSGFSPVDASLPLTIVQTQGSLDRVHHYFGSFVGVKYGADASGHTGLPGDYAADLGNPPVGTSRVLATDPDMLAALRNAVANDTLSCSIWVKRRTMASSSDFWFNSPTAPVSGRAFQLHGPYSDNNFYFDTGGGTVPTSRLQASSTQLPAYQAVGSVSFWTNNVWHHIVVVKDGGAKTIYVDGVVLTNQPSGAATISGYNDLNLLCIGAASPANLVVNGLVDDFAAYSDALTQSEVQALFAGTPPNAITSAPNLLVWWDFDDAPDAKLTNSGGNAVVSFRQTLQVSTNVSGPYADVTASPSNTFTTNLNANQKLFFRARK